MMTKRQAILMLLSLPFGAFTAMKAGAAGILRIPLDQWTRLDVEYEGRTLTFTPRQIFEALK